MKGNPGGPGMFSETLFIRFVFWIQLATANVINKVINPMNTGLKIKSTAILVL